MLSLAPAEDAELLCETTARFLAQTCDLTVVREWATNKVKGVLCGLVGAGGHISAGPLC